MKKNRTIQIKATILMLVFSLNTLLGFACSLGLKMGYNNHHEEQQKTVSLKHRNHQKEPASHHHSQKQSESKDDCCSNGVTSFNLLDKTTTNTVSFVHPVFATAFIGSFYLPQLLQKLFIPKNIRAFAQSYHPPIPDILIAIQTFRI